MDSTVQTVLLFVLRYCLPRGQTVLLFTVWSNCIIVHQVVKLCYCLSPFFFLFLINFQQRLRIGEKSQSWQA